MDNPIAEVDAGLLAAADAFMYEHDGMVHDDAHPPLFARAADRWPNVKEPWTETPLFSAAALQAERERAAAEERHRIEWMTEALRLTCAMAASPPMPSTGGLSAEHIRGMPDRIAGFSSAKLGRWLGWAQAAIVAGGLADLDDMKRLNMQASARALPLSETETMT